MSNYPCDTPKGTQNEAHLAALAAVQYIRADAADLRGRAKAMRTVVGDEFLAGRLDEAASALERSADLRASELGELTQGSDHV